MGYTNLPKKGPFYDYFSRTTVYWTVFGGVNGDGYGHDGYASDLAIPFSTYGIILLLETASSVVEVSFNGADVHCRLDSNIANGIAQKFEFENRVNSLIWFRAVSGVSPIVQVNAWSIR